MTGAVKGSGFFALALGIVSASAPVRAAIDIDWQSRLPTFPRFDAEEIVESHLSTTGRFAVHYTRNGRNAVPATDVDGDGVPDQVALVARTAGESIDFYERQLGLSPFPDDGARPSRFDVFLLDFAGRGDGQFVAEDCRGEEARICAGLLIVENDFRGYRYGSTSVAVRTVVSHELFHAVQAAAGADNHPVFAEGSATWATEAFDGSLDDFERTIPGYLSAPDQPLAIAPSGPVSTFSYGAALFFRFLSERFGDGTVAAILTSHATPAPPDVTPVWLRATDATLVAAGANFATAFADFAIWNALTGLRAPTAGRGSTSDVPRGYLEAARYPLLATSPRTLPLAEPVFRVFPASARAYTFAAAGPPLHARLSILEGAGPIELALVGRRAGTWSLVDRGPSQVTATSALDPDSDVILVVSNGAKSGNSTRVRLCAGETEAALSPCPMSSTPMPLSSAPPDEGGGCGVLPAAPPSASRGFVAAGLVVLLLALIRRRGRVLSGPSTPNRTSL